MINKNLLMNYESKIVESFFFFFSLKNSIFSKFSSRMRFGYLSGHRDDIPLVHKKFDN